MTSIDTTKPPAAAPGPDDRENPAATLPAHRDDDAPILPMWLRDRATFTNAARVHARRHARRAARWATGLPRLLVLLILWSPRGCGRVTAQLARWVYDRDTADLRTRHAHAGETADYAKAHAARRANLHARWIVAGVAVLVVATPILLYCAPQVLACLLGVAVLVGAVKAIPGRGPGEVVAGLLAGAAVAWWAPGLLALVPRLPIWPFIVAAVVAIPVLGWVGRPLGRPIAKVSVDGPEVVPLRAPMVRDALCSIGIGGLKDPSLIRLLSDVHRHGPGVQVDVELPAGVAASSVMDKREELAAALRRELGTVWPSVGVRHPGHLALYVADTPMSTGRQAPWPLLKGGTVNIFRPAPLATDQRNAWVDVTLAYTAWVVGAVPRMGKTFFVREWLLVAGLDVRARVYAFDLKGTGDLSPCALYAHGYGVGDEPEDIEAQLDQLRAIQREMRRRAKVIRELPREVCPENKVTDDLAGRRDLGLEPIVVGADECQVWFEHPDRATREEFIAICTDLVKRGPALGIICLFATQKPDAKSIPTAISANASARFCLKVNGQPANDQVLGTSMYREGIRATLFSFRDKGIGYLIGDGADAQIVRTVAGLDAVASEQVAQRARAMRETAGRLTGQAAGLEDERTFEPDLLADCRDVLDNLDGGRAAMHLVDLVEALAAYRETWARLDADALGAMLREAGAEVGQVKIGGRNTSGVRRAALEVEPDEVGEDAAG